MDLFNYALALATVLYGWRAASIVPIFMKDDLTDWNQRVAGKEFPLPSLRRENIDSWASNP